MEVFKQRPFKVGEREFVTMVGPDKEPGSVRVWVQTKDGGPVVVTLPGGATTTMSYSVTMEVRHDLAVLQGIKVVDRLMETAEATVREQIEHGWV